MQILFATHRRCWQKEIQPVAIVLFVASIRTLMLSALRKGSAVSGENTGGYIFTFAQTKGTRLRKFSS